MPRRNGKPGEECSIRGSSKCNCRGRFGDHPAWARFKLWTRRNGGSPTASREIATIYGPRRERRLLVGAGWCRMRSDEHTSELQSLMRISYADLCLKQKNKR